MPGHRLQGLPTLKPWTKNIASLAENYGPSRKATIGKNPLKQKQPCRGLFLRSGS